MQDILIELTELPQPLPGAPQPVVFADEHRIVLAYWEKDSDSIAVVRFQGPCFHQFGPPNEEAIAGHPLASRGLYPCGVFQVKHSSLVQELERRNRVHQYHDPQRFDDLSHYIFTFHDSTFECVAESILARVEQARTGRGPEHQAYSAFRS